MAPELVLPGLWDRFWLALKTANPIERLHREMKRRTKAMDSIGEDSLTVVIAFTALRMELGWRRHRVDARSVRNLAAYNRGQLGTDNVVEEALGQRSSGLDLDTTFFTRPMPGAQDPKSEPITLPQHFEYCGIYRRKERITLVNLGIEHNQSIRQLLYSVPRGVFATNKHSYRH